MRHFLRNGGDVTTTFEIDGDCHHNILLQSHAYEWRRVDWSVAHLCALNGQGMEQFAVSVRV